MSAPDFVINQGETEPIFAQQIYDSTGSPVNLAGATGSLVLRNQASPSAVTVTGRVTIFDAANGKIQWQPSAQDTSAPGLYQAKWQITWANGTPQSYPTDGWLEVSIEPSLVAMPQQIVGLADVKDYIASFGIGVDRSHDVKLNRFINAATPLIENVVGPVIVRQFEEWHDGGSDLIQLHRLPSAGFETEPVLQLVGASEYRGPIEYPLSVIASPVFGSIYSVFLDPDMGTITRRTAGGRTIAFMPGRQSIHVIYRAGQSQVPMNVYQAALETVRWNYVSTLATGGGSRSLADAEDLAAAGGLQPGVLPPSARQWLTPNRRHPSFA